MEVFFDEFFRKMQSDSTSSSSTVNIVFEEEAAPLPWTMRQPLYDRDLPVPADRSTARPGSLLVPSPLLQSKTPHLQIERTGEDPARVSPASSPNLSARSERVVCEIGRPFNASPSPHSSADGRRVFREPFSSDEENARDLASQQAQLVRTSPPGSDHSEPGRSVSESASIPSSEAVLNKTLWFGTHTGLDGLIASQSSLVSESAIHPIPKVHENAKLLREVSQSSQPPMNDVPGPAFDTTNVHVLADEMAPLSTGLGEGRTSAEDTDFDEFLAASASNGWKSGKKPSRAGNKDQKSLVQPPRSSNAGRNRFMLLSTDSTSDVEQAAVSEAIVKEGLDETVPAFSYANTYRMPSPFESERLAQESKETFGYSSVVNDSDMAPLARLNGSLLSGGTGGIVAAGGTSPATRANGVIAAAVDGEEARMVPVHVPSPDGTESNLSAFNEPAIYSIAKCRDEATESPISIDSERAKSPPRLAHARESGAPSAGTGSVDGDSRVGTWNHAPLAVAAPQTANESPFHSGCESPIEDFGEADETIVQMAAPETESSGHESFETEQDSRPFKKAHHENGEKLALARMVQTTADTEHSEETRVPSMIFNDLPFDESGTIIEPQLTVDSAFEQEHPELTGGSGQEESTLSFAAKQDLRALNLSAEEESKLWGLIAAYTQLDTSFQYNKELLPLGLLMLRKHQDKHEALDALCRMMHEQRHCRFFSDESGDLQRLLRAFDSLLKTRVPSVADHLKSKNISAADYASTWFLTAYSAGFPREFADKAQGVYCDDREIELVRIGLALVISNEESILAETDRDCLLTLLLSGLRLDPAALPSLSAAVNVSQADMDLLYAQYALLKDDSSDTILESEIALIKQRHARAKALLEELGELVDQMSADLAVVTREKALYKSRA